MTMITFLLWFAFVIGLYKIQAKWWMWLLFVLGTFIAIVSAYSD